MCDFDCAIFLCCLNLFKINCLEYTCLIISLFIFLTNMLGIIFVQWNIIKFFTEAIYSTNVAICFFNIFIIILIVYSTKIGRITTNEFYKIFSVLSILSIFISLYLFISYSLSSYLIFEDYLFVHRIIQSKKYSNSEMIKLKKIFKLKITWIIFIFTTILPSILSFITILLWISLYYRISYRIYCSFNKGIRKELREQRKKNRQYREFQENESKNESDISKDKEKQSIKNYNNISVVIEKDRHPATKIVSGGSIYTNINNADKSKIQIKIKEIPNFNKGNEYKDSDIVSSDRNLEKSNNQIK